MKILNMIPGGKMIKKKQLEISISTLEKEIRIAEADLTNYKAHLQKAKSELEELRRE